METIKNEYLKQAEDFLKKTSTILEIEFSYHGKYFQDDKEERDIYNCTLKRGERKYSFTFGNSLNNSGFYYTKGRQKINLDRKLLEGKKSIIHHIKYVLHDFSFLNNGKSDIIHKPIKPNSYDILACLEKYGYDTFEDFCSVFGYDTDSKKAEKIYNACKDQYLNLCTIFNNDEMDELREIQ